MLTVGMENGRVSVLQLPRMTTRWHIPFLQESLSSTILGQASQKGAWS